MAVNLTSISGQNMAHWGYMLKALSTINTCSDLSKVETGCISDQASDTLTPTDMLGNTFLYII